MFLKFLQTTFYKTPPVAVSGNFLQGRLFKEILKKKVLKKGTSNQKLQDRCGHVVFSDENFSRCFIWKNLAQKMLIEKGLLYTVY